MAIERRPRRLARSLAAWAVPAALLAARALGEEPMTLEAALALAHTANARLPIPSAEVEISRARRSEADAARWLQVAVEGGFLYAPLEGGIGYDPALSNLGEARLVAVARQPIYAGGALDAGRARAQAGLEVAGARFRAAEKDLDLDVRGRCYELLAAREEARVRRAGLERLDTYLRFLRERQTSGQAVAADLVKTEVRRALEESAIVEAEQRAEDARIQLNALFGRTPDAPLELAALLAPSPPPSESEAAPWQTAPEVVEAEALTRSSQADVSLAHAERLPHLNLNADAGFWESDTRHLNADFWDRLWRSRGYSFSLVLSWSVWDRGALKARETAAGLALAQARSRVEAERRNAATQWSQARSAMRHLYREIETLSRAAPMARDAYLGAESRYRGGTATALDVLDSYSAAVDATVRLSEVTTRFRLAEAVALRWGTP